MAALAEVAVTVGTVMVCANGAIASMDLNPVLVGAVDEWAVLVERGEHAGAAPPQPAQAHPA
ncbi:hypothetical protein [Acidovorax sp.]|uniref:hypothetical protein n=1 Tax=Acidovorax sp. TaxID=1872122 RepID=UPI002ACE0080|nr:hypothetical protein [Acidovorax sp.]MDZ7862923.1 hypothetical protein [Acidovorax sp.]